MPGDFKNDVQDLKERMVRIETKLDTWTRLLEKIEGLQEKSQENHNLAERAYDHADKAHTRLDKKDKEESKLKWIIYTTLIVGVLGLIMNNGGG